MGIKWMFGRALSELKHVILNIGSMTQRFRNRTIELCRLPVPGYLI